MNLAQARGGPQLKTERLELRPIERSDFEQFYELLIKDPAVMEFYHAYLQPMDESARRARADRDFFEHFEKGAREHGYIAWALCAGPGMQERRGTFLGWCGITTPGLSDPAIGPEVAYMLGQKWQGQGLVTEATRAVILDAFERYGLETIHAVVDSPNTGSRRVLEKLGFEFRGPVSVYGSDDMVLYVTKQRDSVNSGPGGPLPMT